jgi:UPF0755 protein
MRQKLLWVAIYIPLGLIVLYLSVSLCYWVSGIVSAKKVMIRIKEGETVADINKELKAAGVFSNYELPSNLEGYLYPDTYEFFVPSGEDIVLQKFLNAFNSKAAPLFADNRSLKDVLIAASLIEKEVPPDGSDRQQVSGIIWKRLDASMPLQIDASLCYIKPEPCLPLTKSDTMIDSPYNTYRYTGLPPSPIGSPSADAIYAALHPTPSPYWFFLSDPKTKKTIFAKTLDEHSKNIVKYLE